MLHAMDRAQLCDGNDLTAEKLPYVLRPQNALSVAQRMWSNDFERSKLIRFDPMPRHTRYTQRLPFPSSLENAIRTGRLILMLDDARMITAPVVSQRNGELQTSRLERESLLFRTTIERALNRSSFSSGRINPADQPKTAPMSFAESIAVNNKYLLSEGKKAKDKEYVVDLQCVWDNGQSVGEIPIQLSFDNGVVQRYMLPANGHLQVTGVSSLFYKAQLKPDLDNTELSALRTSIQKTLTAIIEKEKAQAAIHQSLQDQMGVVDNVRVHTGAVMWGIWNLAKDSVVAVKEWSDVINPVVAYNNALQAAYVARQAGPESDWSETFRETYNDLQHREWVEALGFDPSKITMAQLAEAYEFANFVYEDPPTQKMLTKFGREYIAAQDSVEFAESVAPTVIVTILGAILTATTLGAGGAVVAGRVAKEFADLGKLLIDLGKALKKAKLSERIFSKMSNKLEKLEIRRPKAQKVAEPKRVDGNRNDGTMRGGSVLPNKKLTIEGFTAPTTGKTIHAAVDGSAAVPLDKVNIYARGKVTDVTNELRDLQRFKQTDRKLFDADPNNAKRLDRLKSQKHNFERSSDMNRHLENIGLKDSPENNQMIIEHLLQVGNKVTPDNRVWVPSVLNGPKGSLQVETTWKILQDQRAYLTTLKFMPINK